MLVIGLGCSPQTKSPYSEDFRGFMDTNGIEGDIKNYMQNLNKHLFSGEASWFQTYVKLHGEVGLNAAMSNAEKILSISGINEETKQKIQELSREKAFETLNDLYEEAQKGITIHASGYGGGGGGGSGWNHGGYIKPIYRAMGGPARGVDTISAMLQPGEFVVRKSSVARAGLSALTAINRGDIMSAARSLGNRVATSYNNSRNWSNTVNNNQRTSNNSIRIFNRTAGSRVSSYRNLANRIALA